MIEQNSVNGRTSREQAERTSVTSSKEPVTISDLTRSRRRSRGSRLREPSAFSTSARRRLDMVRRAWSRIEVSDDRRASLGLLGSQFCMVSSRLRLGPRRVASLARREGGRVDGRAGRFGRAARDRTIVWVSRPSGPVRLTTRYGIVRTTTMLHAYYTAEFLVWNLCARPPHGHG